MWVAQLLDKGVWVVCMWCMYDVSPVTGPRSNSCMYDLYVWYKEPSYWTREYELCVCAICMMLAQLPGQGLIVLCVNYMSDVRSPVTGWGKYELCVCVIWMIWAQLLDHGAAVVCMTYRLWCEKPIYWTREYELYVLYLWCEPSYWVTAQTFKHEQYVWCEEPSC